MAWLADVDAVDVLVVGGGVTGAGVALDAASRGLSVALVERGDLAQGTSRWSSKLVHGGLRYLAHGDVGLAYESAFERRLLMTRVAPHLVRALPMLTPLAPTVQHRRAAAVGAALASGEVLARAARTSRRTVPAPRRLGAAEARRLVPALRDHGLRGAFVHWEGQLEDDARLVVALARTAAAYGARILTACAVLALTGRGAHVQDELTGETFGVRARHVVNATGVWADRLDPAVRLRPSRGSHLVLRSSVLGHPAAAMSVPVPGEGTRFVLALPQPDGLCYVGLTDEAHTGPVPDDAVVTDSETGYLLGVLESVLDRPVPRADVVGSFTGFRPLLDQPGRTVDLSRRHAIHRNGDGVHTITGGKLTTYRRMACEVTDRLTDRRSVSHTLPLVGAGSLPAGARHVPRRLVRRYGVEAPMVAALAESDPSLAEPLASGVDVLGVEVAWSVLHEGALSTDDVLARRTRLGLVPADAAAAKPAVEAILASLCAPTTAPPPAPAR